MSSRGPTAGEQNGGTKSWKGADFFPVFMGCNVLRTETAGIFAIAAVRIILPGRKDWKTVK